MYKLYIAVSNTRIKTSQIRDMYMLGRRKWTACRCVSCRASWWRWQKVLHTHTCQFTFRGCCNACALVPFDSRPTILLSCRPFTQSPFALRGGFDRTTNVYTRIYNIYMLNSHVHSPDRVLSRAIANGLCAVMMRLLSLRWLAKIIAKL